MKCRVARQIFSVKNAIFLFFCVQEAVLAYICIHPRGCKTKPTYFDGWHSLLLIIVSKNVGFSEFTRQKRNKIHSISIFYMVKITTENTSHSGKNLSDSEVSLCILLYYISISDFTVKFIDFWVLNFIHSFQKNTYFSKKRWCMTIYLLLYII